MEKIAVVVRIIEHKNGSISMGKKSLYNHTFTTKAPADIIKNVLGTPRPDWKSKGMHDFGKAHKNFEPRTSSQSTENFKKPIQH